MPTSTRIASLVRRRGRPRSAGDRCSMLELVRQVRRESGSIGPRTPGGPRDTVTGPSTSPSGSTRARGCTRQEARQSLDRLDAEHAFVTRRPSSTCSSAGTRVMRSDSRGRSSSSSRTHVTGRRSRRFLTAPSPLSAGLEPERGVDSLSGGSASLQRSGRATSTKADELNVPHTLKISKTSAEQAPVYYVAISTSSDRREHAP